MQDNNQPQETNQPVNSQAQWQYTSGSLNQEQKIESSTYKPLAANEPDKTLFSWRASEFASNDKRVTWYVYLFLLTIVVAAIIFFISRNIMSVAVLVILAIVVAIYGNIKPRTLDYSITTNGVKISEKFYPFSSFKSFSVLDDMAVPSIHLTPIKRLAIPINIYVAPVDLDKIVEAIGNNLPFEQKKRDFADQLSHKLKF